MSLIRVQVDAPNKIIMSGVTDDVTSLEDIFELAETQTEGNVTLKFSQNNALALRTFLPGREFEITDTDKKILKYLADNGEEALFWDGNLFHLENVKKNSKAKRSLLDWLHYFPYRYVDRSNPQNVEHLNVNEDATVVGEIVSISRIASKGMKSKGPVPIRITIKDSSGRTISGSFFNQPWLFKTYNEGDSVIMTGKYTEYYTSSGNKFYPQISNPKIDKLDTIKGSLKLIPVYSQRNGIKGWEVMNDNIKTLNQIPYILDPLPESIINKRGLISREDSYRKIHFPQNVDDIEKAKERIAYDELIQLQVYFEHQKQQYATQRGAEKTNTSLCNKMVEELPYKLTTAQSRAIKEVAEDMASPKPMHRILQGDVSSGKSTVAAAAILVAVGSGYQAALVAPTEILATQLYDRIKEDIHKVDPKIKVEFLGGKTKASEKKDLYKRLKYGDIDVLIGTHAILQDKVVFYDLGLVVIDEQHKFGTKQRSRLLQVPDEAITPDMLIMSATPIPRTMASVIYGNLDVSILDELPAGRLPIETIWVEEPKEAWEKIKEEVALGHQAYVVTSLVNESETIDAKSAEETYLNLKKILPNMSIGLMHGKLANDEKLETMNEFAAGNIDVLVATTVIEVGVNVPNATVMVVLNAERFGMSGLHQIRGRVGRSSLPSTCYLVGKPNTPEGEDRLQALVASNDGFYIAEKDMEIRGEGTLFGINQSGESDLKLANLHDHMHLLDYAKEDVTEAIKSEALVAEVKKIYETLTIDS